MGSPEHKQKIWNLISDIGIGMLTTQSDESLRARPMQIVQEAYDGTLWFFTEKQTSKVEEIRDDEHVCVSFSCPEKGVFVSMSGTARIQKDQDRIDLLWSDKVSAWLKADKDSAECALLEVKIHHGEHWKNESGFLKSFMEEKKAEGESDKRPNVGEHETF